MIFVVSCTYGLCKLGREECSVIIRMRMFVCKYVIRM